MDGTSRRSKNPGMAILNLQVIICSLLISGKLTLMLLVDNFKIQNNAKKLKMTGTLANGYS